MIEKKYTKCFKCKKPFKDGDDIVVCPICGTPYHRECYMEEGKCINTKLHETHETYSEEVEKAKATGTAVICPACHHENPPLALFCSKCGMPLNSATDEDKKDMHENKDFKFENYTNIFGRGAYNTNFSDPLCGIDPEENFNGVTTRELADFIGTNGYYYLPLFKVFNSTKHKFTFNFSAMLFPEFYFAYRKMYHYSVLAIVVKAIISIPTFIVMLQTPGLINSTLTEFASSFDIRGSTFMLLYNLCSFLNYAFMALFGMFGNYMYYKFAIDKIKTHRINGKSDRKVVKAIGGVSKLAVGIVAGSLFIISIILSLLTIWG